jgi:hypothetical protein
MTRYEVQGDWLVDPVNNEGEPEPVIRLEELARVLADAGYALVQNRDLGLHGRLVRWDSDGQWFTARVEVPDSFSGYVVDPGNFVGLDADRFGSRPLAVGNRVSLLRRYLTVLEEPEGAEEASDGP